MGRMGVAKIDNWSLLQGQVSRISQSLFVCLFVYLFIIPCCGSETMGRLMQHKQQVLMCGNARSVIKVSSRSFH